jgi:hypothetical protein
MRTKLVSLSTFKAIVQTSLVIFSLAFVQSAQASEDEVKVFFDTCMKGGTKFGDVGKLAAGLGFEPEEDRTWTRKADGLSISLMDAPDRYVCAVLRIGDQTKRFKNEVIEFLKTQSDYVWEDKSYDGRTVILVANQGENTLIEVIPPPGAITFITANLRKK